MSRLSPLDSLATSLHHAVIVGLPNEQHIRVDHEKTDAYRAEHGRAPDSPITRTIEYRPSQYSCKVDAMFMQTWGSTSLGFGGLGGAAMTDAYTVVLAGPRGHLVVYWGGSLGYTVNPEAVTPKQLKAFRDDLAKSRTVSQSEAVNRYGAVLPQD